MPLALVSLPCNEPHAQRDALHRQEIVAYGGYIYKGCSCGWISLGSTSWALAAQTECPVEQAEIERDRNVKAFAARLEDLWTYDALSTMH